MMTVFAQENLSHIQTLEQEKKNAQSKVESLLRMAESGNAPLSLLDRIRQNEESVKSIDLQLAKIEKQIKKITLTEHQLQEIFELLKKEKEPAALKLLVQSLVCSILLDPEKDEMKIILKIDAAKYGITATNLGWLWWRRGESNPCPEAQSQSFLRAQSVI